MCNDWAIQKRKELIKAFGEKCEDCGSTYRLEFAHKEHSANGRGRGRNKRIIEVFRNPELFRLLCWKCHDLYDGRKPRYDHQPKIA